LEYKYDSLGNITHIYKNNELINQYYYDQYNQLIKEESNNSKIIYEYDNYGNILSKKTYQNNELVYISTYQYNNTNWQDQLTYYKECKVEKDENGNEVYTITDEENLYYDELGNMSFTNEIGEPALRYINGRQLSRYAKDDKLILYNYNKDGIRTYKGNGKDINNEYYVEGNKIVYIKMNNNYMYFIYENDNVVGFKYNDIIYYYNKNLTNDIIGIRNSNNETIANYEYDSFGNILSITDNNNNKVTDENHIANINLFRYRSYYYDIETNLYYLNSRYYNPKWGRFISADSYISTGQGILGYNMYSYCNNNPISFIDKNGHFITSSLVLGIALVGTAVAINTYVQNKRAKNEIKRVQDKYPNSCPNPFKSMEFDRFLKNNSNKIKSDTENMNQVDKMKYFITNVKTGGIYDLKNTGNWKEDIYYDGHVMESQDIGNYHFGYIGRAIGYDIDFLTAGAGAYQLYEHPKEFITYFNCITPSLCDDPRDTYYIRLGAIAYDRNN